MKKRFLINTVILFALCLFYSCSEDTIDTFGEGTLNGSVVTDVNNEPLANVKISTTPASSTVFTDENGEFIISSISSDDYSVQAELDGYVTSFEAATITPNETSNVVFEMVTAGSINKQPLEAQLLSPEDGATGVAPEVNFVWSSGSVDDDVLKYSLELRNGTTNETEVFEIEGDTTYTASNLSLGTNYFWQISTDDLSNPVVRSEVSQFKTIDIPNNRFLYVREMNGNSVIFSGDNNSENPNEAELRLTSLSTNSFRPRRNTDVNKIAFLRTVSGNTHLFTMNLDGTNVKQVTNSIPVNGFRISEIDYTWAQNGSRLYYPSFGKLYSIDPDGGGAQLIYETTDGSFITEISAAAFDDDLIAIKTNDTQGYGVRIFTVRLSSGTEENVVIEGVNGAAGGLDLNANASQLLYTRDVSNSENSQYRLFNSRLFIYDFQTMTSTAVRSDVQSGDNDLDPRWSPSEGAIIFTRIGNNIEAIPNIFSISIDDDIIVEAQLLFTEASQPDWE